MATIEDNKAQVDVPDDWIKLTDLSLNCEFIIPSPDFTKSMVSKLMSSGLKLQTYSIQSQRSDLKSQSQNQSIPIDVSGSLVKKTKFFFVNEGWTLQSIGSDIIGWNLLAKSNELFTLSSQNANASV